MTASTPRPIPNSRANCVVIPGIITIVIPTPKRVIQKTNANHDNEPLRILNTTLEIEKNKKNRRMA